MTHMNQAVAVAPRHLRVDLRYDHVRTLRGCAHAVDTRSQGAEPMLIYIPIRSLELPGGDNWRRHTFR